MTNTECLIEAVEYAVESGTEWYESFDSEKLAMKILKAARREEIEEEQAICFLSAIGIEYDMLDYSSPESIYRKELNEMKRKLSERIMS